MNTTASRSVRLSPMPPAFGLPEHVALAEGLFARAGLDVGWSADYLQPERNLGEVDPLARLTESSFERQASDVYTACEWGTITRVERTSTDGKVYHLRPAVAAQVILSFDEGIQEPRDLAGVAIAMNELTGSHFTTLQMLGDALRKEDIVLQHVGAPELRLQHLRDKSVRAATLMEPFVSVAIKEGAHIVESVFYRGAYVIAPHLSTADRETYVGAVNQAVDRINADFSKYQHFIEAGARGALEPGELSKLFVRYVHVAPFAPERFKETYEWMQAWGLTDGRRDFETLVTA